MVASPDSEVVVWGKQRREEADSDDSYLAE